jgi:shikimate dehydrogenase
MDTFSIKSLRESKEMDLRLAVLGDPVKHSLSPPMQNAGLEYLHLPYRYERLHVRPDDLAEAFNLLRERDYIGWNLTLPHKLAALDLLDSLDPQVQRLRSVNTVVNQSGRLFGFNTDAAGFVAAINEAFDCNLSELRIAVFGAGGGTGQTVVRHLSQVGVPLLILVNRTAAKIERLAEEIDARSTETRIEIRNHLADVFEEADLIVNASSPGLDGELIPATWKALEPRHLVFDMVYGPQETPFVRFARERGARAADGLLMLLHQGVLSFEIWFGKPAPRSVMRTALWRAAGRECRSN